MADNCLICTRIEQIKQKTNKYFVAELSTGYVVLGDFQFFRGYTLFLCKQHHSELHHLEKNYRQQFLEEMSVVAHAVFETFKPEKLNYELLGNSESHLHWHLFPRYADDPALGKPVWVVDKAIRYAEEARPSDEQLLQLKQQLLTQLNVIGGRYIINRATTD